MQPLNATSRYRQSKHGVVFWLMPSSVAFMLPWRSRKRLLRPRLLGDSYLGWPACRPDHLCVLHMYTSSVLKKGACFWNENSKNGPNFLKNRRWQKCLHFSKNNFKNIIFYGSRQLMRCVALPEKMNGSSESNPNNRMKLWTRFFWQFSCKTGGYLGLVHGGMQLSVDPLLSLSQHCWSSHQR